MRLMVDPRSTCRSGEPWIRTCGTGGGKLLGFIFRRKRFSSSFVKFFSIKHDMARSFFQCLARLCFMLNDLSFRHFWGKNRKFRFCLKIIDFFLENFGKIWKITRYNFQRKRQIMTPEGVYASKATGPKRMIYLESTF